MLLCQWVLVWWSNCKPAIGTLTTKSVENGMKRLQYYSTSCHTFCPLLNQWSSLTATVLYSTSRAPVTVTVTSHSTAHSTNYRCAPVHSTSALPGKFLLPEWHIAFTISHMPKPIAVAPSGPVAVGALQRDRGAPSSKQEVHDCPRGGLEQIEMEFAVCFFSFRIILNFSKAPHGTCQRHTSMSGRGNFGKLQNAQCPSLLTPMAEGWGAAPHPYVRI